MGCYTYPTYYFTDVEVDGILKVMNLFRPFLILLFHINRCFSCVKFLC